MYRSIVQDDDTELDIDAFAKARKINSYGQVESKHVLYPPNILIFQIGLLVSFFLFMIVYWSIALNHYFNEIRFLDDDGNKLEVPLNYIE